MLSALFFFAAMLMLSPSCGLSDSEGGSQAGSELVAGYEPTQNQKELTDEQLKTIASEIGVSLQQVQDYISTQSASDGSDEVLLRDLLSHFGIPVSGGASSPSGGSSGAASGANYKVPENALPGLFTIDSKGDQVRFSPGLLYWSGSKWKFEENQTDYRAFHTVDCRDCVWIQADSNSKFCTSGFFGRPILKLLRLPIMLIMWNS
ncbi:MAG TPA: hypothetical protein DCO86_03645 [Spirochaetaceae bacterium]|nr:hypothetical protein [Spirochaetaceae bacterium]